MKDTSLGKGIFSTTPIPTGTFLIEMTGPLFDISELPSVSDRAFRDYYIQCAPTKFLGPSGHFDDIFNHSCNPNAGLFFEKGKIFIKTIRDIGNDEEIFYDYSSVVTNDPFVMRCACNNSLCRGEVKAFKTLPKKVRDRYIQLGIVPDYAIASCEVQTQRKRKNQLFPIQQTQTAHA